MLIPGQHTATVPELRLESRAEEPRYRVVCIRCGAAGPWCWYAHGDGHGYGKSAWDSRPDCRAISIRRSA